MDFSVLYLSSSRWFFLAARLIVKRIVVMMEGKPPVALLKTWLWMMLDAKDKELRKEGEAKIIATFSNMKAAIDYLDHHESKSV